MSWRERTVCKILLLVAHIVASVDARTDLHEQLTALANDISVRGKDADQ